MHQMSHAREILERAQGKTALITGASRGIGGETASILNEHGCNIIITDLKSQQQQSESLIQSLRFPERAIFAPASVSDWTQLLDAFKKGINIFGRIDIVVANAGIMESCTVLDMQTDERGDPIESREGNTVLDINLKGTLNTLRLGIHYMSKNLPSEEGWVGSIVLVTSTSGYFGFSGNTAYVASKHGIVGLFRASQPLAEKLNIRVNAIAPSFTPTHITAGFGDHFEKAGVESNTVGQVAAAISFAALDPARKGTCCLVSGKFVRELELTLKDLMSAWMGEDLLHALSGFRAIVNELGGYPLPSARRD
ncbi:uncharacterized protein A1O9_07996 [Exophiala aquamarina CBS 119918]|uniref:3-oxoacyl-[acyl-carrier protein] reductase n=1 Tax=Exophiala aquamarina CBS 119918 TaxID=1182545 RepID=A0A072PLL6_9EURO|nr:uncharacterized protein A1O9_07996 [Exophiala aquamarina CBS 119918]KEF56415.1 hypothetical protein A1O9_07996 [Exophiala aquamarina CBS 119918]